jgi:hypothetical protein
MIKFHYRQSDYVRRARKNENGGTFNFTSQIASSICTVMFTKLDKSSATILKSRCSRTAVNYRLMAWHALPLNFVRFLRLANRSPMNQRSPARRSRNVREPSGNTSSEMSRSQPHHFPATSGQWQMQCRQMSARATRKTTCNVRVTVRATDKATTSETSRTMARRNFVVTSSTMTPKKYEHITIYAESRIAAQGGSGISTQPTPRSIQ